MTVAHMWFDNRIVEADTTENQQSTSSAVRSHPFYSVVNLDATYDKSAPGWVRTTLLDSSGVNERDVCLACSEPFGDALQSS